MAEARTNTSRSNTSGGGNNTAQRNQFHNTRVSLFDRVFSALGFTMSSDGGLLAFSPIFSEFVGKEPKKGDKVYNHDERLNVGISAQTAVGLRATLDQFLAMVDGETIENPADSCSFSWGMGENQRTITIFAPGRVKLKGQTFDDYVIKLEAAQKEGPATKMFHIFSSATATYNAGRASEGTIPVHHELLTFREFLTAVIDSAFGAQAPAVRMYIGQTGSSSAGKSRSYSEVDEEPVDAGGNTAAPAPEATERAVTSVSEEFSG